MSHNILITGVSGYLGGTLLARLASANLPSYNKLYALVRTDEQAESVKLYGAEPLRFDLEDEKAVLDNIVGHQITIAYHLPDPLSAAIRVNFIKALAKVKMTSGGDVHFLHVCLAVYVPLVTPQSPQYSRLKPQEIMTNTSS
jgi:uncharacterized protein YbjT (DUF2867 family)